MAFYACHWARDRTAFFIVLLDFVEKTMLAMPSRRQLGYLSFTLGMANVRMEVQANWAQRLCPNSETPRP